MYKKDTNSEWTTVPVSTTTYTITGLSPVSTYYAKVQANCGEGDLSKWAETTFTTGCGAIDLPYTCDFEGTSQTVNNCKIPSCWSVIKGYQNSTYSYGIPTVANQSSSTQPIAYPHGGSYCLYFLNSTYSGTSEEYAILPEISDAYNMSNIQIRFWVRSYSSPCTMEVGVMTDPSNASTYVKIEDVEMTKDYTEKTISLNNYSGIGRYIALKCPSPTMYSQAFYVDDITVENNPDYLFTKDITAYSGDGGYYLIASPVGEVNPENITNMLSNNYDLYRFNQSAPVVNGISLEWENYKQESFSLEPGKGYLYANDHDVTLQFTGTAYNGENTITLTKTDNVDWSGWNLVGNPFAQTAYITKAFYTMNGTGSEVVAGTGNSIEAMEGIFVIAEQNNEEMTFSTTQPAELNQQLVINVTQNRGAAIDRAIVRFGGTSSLPKLQLNPSHTKVYIPQSGKDYAIVHSTAQGEMPVNFKAEKNGSYTLNVNAENMSMNYLHLIDNMTGADVDLLATPSYTFEATTRDYASRFRMVFSANETDGPSSGSGSFAYFNGSEWQISNMGSATLQVIDVMGRVLSNETISGNAEIHLNQPAGIYMLRLINGNNVKVQKVVVR